MKPIKITKQDTFGYERTFIIRHSDTCDKVFLVEIDPDFGFESFCGVFNSETIAFDRIEMLIH